MGRRNVRGGGGRLGQGWRRWKRFDFLIRENMIVVLSGSVLPFLSFLGL